MITADALAESDKGPDLALAQHILVCALHELGCLVQSLGTSSSPLVSEPSTGIIEPVVSVLIHPAPAARLAAAWCLRAIAVALPSHMTILIERCMNRMHHLKSCPEAVSGYSFALVALLGGVREVSLGVPHAKGKVRMSSHSLQWYSLQMHDLWWCFAANLQLSRRIIENCHPEQSTLSTADSIWLASFGSSHDSR